MVCNTRMTGSHEPIGSYKHDLMKLKPSTWIQTIVFRLTCLEKYLVKNAVTVEN